MRRIFVTLAAGALSACGSDDKTSAEKAVSSLADAAKKGTSGDSGSSGDSKLDALIAKQKKANIFVTYKNGDNEFSVAQDGKGNSVYISGGTTTISTKDGQMISCTDTEEDAQCIEANSSGAGDGTSFMQGFGAYTALLSQLGSTGLADVKTTSTTIADRDATCATLSASAMLKGIAGEDVDNSKTTICVDDETGFFLKLEGAGDDGIVATEVRDATADDFKPPVEPKTIDELTPSTTVK